MQVRSAWFGSVLCPEAAREIAAIFFAMTLGLATGTGYLGLAALFFFIFAAVHAAAFCAEIWKGAMRRSVCLKITIPENLNYEGLFSDVFTQYLSSCCA